MSTGQAGKGDKRRPKDKDHMLYPNEYDMGQIGCKKGWHVFRGGPKCIYCNGLRKDLTKLK